MVAFQPIMVMNGATGHDLGVIYELISVLAIVPPLLVAYLSKRLMDRTILLIGLVLKALGILLFLPIFGPVRTWCVVLGFILVIKGVFIRAFRSSSPATERVVHFAAVHHSDSVPVLAISFPPLLFFAT